MKARGTYRADRARNEVKGPRGIPRCPAWLDKIAKHCWRQLLPMLMRMGVLTRIDRNAIIRYCTFWSRWMKAERFLAKHGDVYPLKDGNGNTKCLAPFPQVSIANKLGLLLTRFEQEFGMTPSARTRIDCTAAEADSESIEEYLRHRCMDEKYFKKKPNGMSAEEALDILRKAKPITELKIDWGPEGPPKHDDDDE